MNRYLLAGNENDIQLSGTTAGTTRSTRKVWRKFEIIQEINSHYNWCYATGFFFNHTLGLSHVYSFIIIITYYYFIKLKLFSLVYI